MHRTLLCSCLIAEFTDIVTLLILEIFETLLGHSVFVVLLSGLEVSNFYPALLL